MNFQRSDFYYALPATQIAKMPCTERVNSRLLVLNPDTEEYQDQHFYDLPQFLKAGDLLVFNDTRVIPARLNATKDSGGQVEVLIERLLSTHEVLAQVRASKSLHPGRTLKLSDGTRLKVIERKEAFYHLQFLAEESALDVLHRVGEMPLPPYMARSALAEDTERYQTVYAKNPGAVAAPTAGLHFNQALLDQLKLQGVQLDFVTLHVGAGTFQPVRVDNIETHVMHREWMQVNTALINKIQETKRQGGRVFAVGTTAVRALETVFQQQKPEALTGETQIFIYPGYKFRVIDGLITNFHLPESTLLMLVCALAGYEFTMRAYAHAVETGYRFFSYGDAMLITPRPVKKPV